MYTFFLHALLSLSLFSPLSLSLILLYILHTIKKSWKKSITHLIGFNDWTWHSWRPMSHAASGNTAVFHSFVTTDSRGILIHFWWSAAFKSRLLSPASWPSLSRPGTILKQTLCHLKSLRLQSLFLFAESWKQEFIRPSKNTKQPLDPKRRASFSAIVKRETVAFVW